MSIHLVSTVFKKFTFILLPNSKLFETNEKIAEVSRNNN